MKSDECLLKELEMVASWGVKLYLCGKPATPKVVAECCVREDEVYMPDFIYDEEGNLNELHYDKISNF